MGYGFVDSMSIFHWYSAIFPHSHLIGARCCKKWSNCPLNTALWRLLLQLALASAATERWRPFEAVKLAGFTMIEVRIYRYNPIKFQLRLLRLLVLWWLFWWYVTGVVIHAKTDAEIPTTLVIWTPWSYIVVSGKRHIKSRFICMYIIVYVNIDTHILIVVDLWSLSFKVYQEQWCLWQYTGMGVNQRICVKEPATYPY